MSQAAPFALTGLFSRGGLSNWVFFFDDQLTMIDVGMAPAIKAGMQAAVLGQFGAAGVGVLSTLSYGPQADGTKALRQWSAELRAKAKNIVELQDGQIGKVQLKMNMMGHELFITERDGVAKMFGLMNREQAETAAEPLTQNFGPRFELLKTPVFEFFERHAPFLL